MDELPDDHREAVLAFAAKHGRRWKETLALYWGDGRDTLEPNGWALRSIRNNPNWGHEWLQRVEI